MTRHLRETMSDLGKSRGGSRVDREAGVIRGVKIVGKLSRNLRESKKGRRYTDACLTGAAHLYEGAKVRLNHPKHTPGARPSDRDASDTFGRLVNVRVAPDGLYGDLEYLKSHPMADRVTEAAQRMPSAYGLSHDVSSWAGEIARDGVYEVTAIRKVDGVDLVDGPGSTHGLFESQGGTTVKVARKKLSEILPGWSDPVKDGFNKLLESGEMLADMPVADVPDDPNASIADAFANACLAILKGDGDKASKLEKIGAILDAEEALLASGAIEKADAPEDKPDDPTETPAVEESLRKEVEALKLRESCRRLCESLHVVPTPTDLKLMERLDTEAERKTYLRETAGRRTNQKPAADADADITDGETFAAALLK